MPPPSIVGKGLPTYLARLLGRPGVGFEAQNVPYTVMRELAGNLTELRVAE